MLVEHPGWEGGGGGVREGGQGLRVRASVPRTLTRRRTKNTTHTAVGGWTGVMALAAGRLEIQWTEPHSLDAREPAQHAHEKPKRGKHQRGEEEERGKKREKGARKGNNHSLLGLEHQCHLGHAGHGQEDDGQRAHRQHVAAALRAWLDPAEERANDEGLRARARAPAF